LQAVKKQTAYTKDGLEELVEEIQFYLQAFNNQASAIRGKDSRETKNMLQSLQQSFEVARKEAALDRITTFIILAMCDRSRSKCG
jgi:hypothetical protein